MPITNGSVTSQDLHIRIALMHPEYGDPGHKQVWKMQGHCGRVIGYGPDRTLEREQAATAVAEIATAQMDELEFGVVLPIVGGCRRAPSSTCKALSRPYVRTYCRAYLRT